MTIEPKEELNPNEDNMASFQRAINNMLQASVDIESLQGKMQDSAKRGFDLIGQIQKARLVNPDDAQIEVDLKELGDLATELTEKAEELVRDQGQEMVGQMREQEILATLSGEIPDDQLRKAETQARDAENKCYPDGMTVPMLVLSIAMIAQVSSELTGEQAEPGHDATPLSQMTVDEQVAETSNDCISANFSAMRAKKEMDKREDLLKSVMDQIGAIDKIVRTDGLSDEVKTLAAQLVASTEQFPAYAQDISTFVAEAFASASEAQLRFDAVKDKLVPTKRSELEDKAKQAADAAQDAVAGASFTASVLRVIRHASLQLQQELAV